MNNEIIRINTPTILVIFGATGDLMKRKLVPALFHLYKKKLLPDMFQVVGFSRKDIHDIDFQKQVSEYTQQFDEVSAPDDDFLSLFTYQSGNFQDKESYFHLAEKLQACDDQWGICANKLFYLAVPPRFYKDIFNFLAESKLTEPCSDEVGWSRVLVEKPFGEDLKTAQELDSLLGSLFDEKQIFRIDHYLAKEAVQNILALRFSNSLFESSWNKDAIEKVEIRLLEELGIKGRGSFYDRIGALRDVGQNHILQMLALIAMERPASFDADTIRLQRAQLLRELSATKCGDLNSCSVRGQYDGYGGEEGVEDGSQTETYFKLQTYVENDRWSGVPFYLEAGKQLNRSAVEIIVTFKHIEPCLCPQDSHFQNVFYFQLQPDQEISVSFFAKKPGVQMQLEEKDLLFNYHQAFESDTFVGAYEKILLDCISGDQTLFTSTAELMASWHFIDTILEQWQKQDVPLRKYTKGTSGPTNERITNSE